MDRRYRALRTVGSIYRVLGYIVLVLTILSVIAICGISVLSGTALESVSQQIGVNSNGSGIAGGIVGGIFLSFIALIYGGIVALSLIAFGEGIYLFIAIEENTRKTAIMIENQSKITPSVPQS
jgi:ABC-type phosphate transport system permease subunit